MKWLNLIFFIFWCAMAFAQETTDSKNLHSVLRSPLIIGASVSGNYYVDSPGKLLSLQYTTKEQIHIHAHNGKPGKEVLKSLKEKDLEGRTVVIGVDLFFWDSFGSFAKESVQEMEKFVRLTHKKKIPLIIGEVPVLSLAMQKSVVMINQRMKKLCRDHFQCRILPLNSYLQQTLQKGYLLHNGKQYPLDSLLPDGLHIAKPASEFLAEEIKNLL